MGATLEFGVVPMSDSDDADLGRIVDDDVDSGRDLGHLVDDDDIDLGCLVDDVDLDMDLSRLVSSDDPNDAETFVPSEIAINKPSCHNGSTNKRKADLLKGRCGDDEFIALVRTHDKRQLRVGDQVTLSEEHAKKYDLAVAIRNALKTIVV